MMDPNPYASPSTCELEPRWSAAREVSNGWTLRSVFGLTLVSAIFWGCLMMRTSGVAAGAVAGLLVGTMMVLREHHLGERSLEDGHVEV